MDEEKPGEELDEEEQTPTEENEQEENGQARSVSSDLIRGHINTIILRALYDGDKYGYEILDEIERKSHGQYSLKQPSLYSALKRLEKDGYITSYWGGSVGGGRRKYFSLTDAGKEIAEQNQSEWEYSRTIIDSLISDKDFDFSNPAPSSVNMRVLRSTTSRVPTGADDGEEGEMDFEPIFDESAERERISAEYAEKERQLKEERAKLEAERTLMEEETRLRDETDRERLEAFEKERAARDEEYQAALNAKDEELAARERAFEEERAYLTALRENDEKARLEREAYEAEQNRSLEAIREENARNVALLEEERRHRAEALAEQEVRIRDEMESEFKRREQEILHQNYINLVNTPPAPAPETPYYVAPEEPATPAAAPAADERAYRAVLGRLYAGAVPRETPYPDEPTERARSLGGIDFDDLESRAAQDGIRVVTSGGKSAQRTSEECFVHKGKALFLSALVVFFFCVIVGSVSLGVKNTYGVAIFLPYFIWSIGVALLLVTGLAYANRFGERALKRKSPAILNAIVVYALLVIITLIVALAARADFSSASDLANFIVIPIIFQFGVVIFGVTYFLQVSDLRRK